MAVAIQRCIGSLATTVRWPICGAVPQSLWSLPTFHSISESYYSVRHGKEDSTAGSDPFTRQLQRKTEENLVSVMNAVGKQRVYVVQNPQENDIRDDGEKVCSSC